MASLFKSPKLPKPQPVVRMPDMDDPRAREERERRRRELMGSQGRSSTDLSGDSGDSYINDALGQ